MCSDTATKMQLDVNQEKSFRGPICQEWCVYEPAILLPNVEHKVNSVCRKNTVYPFADFIRRKPLFSSKMRSCLPSHH